MALSDKNSKSTGIFLVIAFIILIVIIAFVMGGARGIMAIFRVLMYLILGSLFLGILFYVIYYLFFKKHRVDLTHENWKKYVSSALENGNDMMTELVLVGDKYHSAKRFMSIEGYLRIKSFDGRDWDMFVGKGKGFPMGVFEEYKIIMLQPNQHSDLIGEVYAYGISLIQMYGYYFLNSDMQDYMAIDKHIAQDTFRTAMYYVLGDMKGLIDRATGLDPEFNKQRQQDKLLKIPVLSGQEAVKSQ